jgi:hypothetical protein
VLLGLGASYTLGAATTSRINLITFLMLFVALPSVSLIVSLLQAVFVKSRRKVIRHLNVVGAGYGLGGICSLLIIYLNQQISVEASTTFPELINESNLSSLIDLLATPFALFGAYFDSIQMTQNLINQKVALPTEGVIAWRNFILSSVAVYTILPRVALYSILKSLNAAMPKSDKNPPPTELFKIEVDQTNIQDYLELSTEEYRLLCSMQLIATSRDVDREENIEHKKLKIEWVRSWKTSIQEGFEQDLITDISGIKQCLKGLTKRGYAKAIVLVFELLQFRPYFEIPSESQSPQDFKTLKFDAKAHRALVDDFTILCGFQKSDMEQAQSAYERQYKKYMGPSKWKKAMFVGAGAALIGSIGLIASPAGAGLAIGKALGLKGLAAKIAGLAVLGGGAVSIKTIGIAGGYAIVVGGGAIMGAGGGLATVYMLPDGAKRIANDIAKFEAVILFLLKEKIDNPLALIDEKLQLLKRNLLAEQETLAQSKLSGDLTNDQKRLAKEIAKGLSLVEKFHKGLTQDFA